MPPVMAIVSRKIFDRDFRANGEAAGVGDVVPTSFYASTHRTFEKLADGGDLFLVTVAPGERLWLVAIFSRPKLAKDQVDRRGEYAGDRRHHVVDPEADVRERHRHHGEGGRTRDDGRGGGGPRRRTREPRSGRARHGTRWPASRVARGAGARRSGPRRGTRRARRESATGARRQHARRARGGLAGGRRRSARRRRAAPGGRVRPDQSQQLKGWLERLETWDADPRIAAGAIASVPLFVSSGAGPTRTVAFRVAKAHGESAYCKPAVDAAIRRTRDAWNADELRDRMRKLLAELPPAHALAADEARHVAKIGKAIDQLAKGPPPEASALASTRKLASSDGTATDLLEAVYADPASDLPRLVYADHLQERGDAYGELIALQLQQDRTKAQTERIAKLLKDKKQVARWLGPLSTIVSEPIFERGLQRCNVKLVTPAHRKLLAHPMFGTVEDIECEDAAVLESAAMRALQRLRGPSAESLAAIADRELPTHVASIVDIPMQAYEGKQAKQLGADNLAAWRTFLDGKAFASVRELGVFNHFGDVATPDNLAWVLASRVGRQLEAFVLSDSYPQAQTWMEALPALKQLTRVRLVPEITNTLDIVKRKGGFDVVLHVDNHEDDYFYDEVFSGFPRKDAPVLQLRFVGRSTRSLDLARRYSIEKLERYFTKIVDAA